jgi:hypothetical protein
MEMELMQNDCQEQSLPCSQSGELFSLYFYRPIKKPQSTSYSGVNIARLVGLSSPWQHPIEKSLKSISCFGDIVIVSENNNKKSRLKPSESKLTLTQA